jgi:hypothetical protein
LILGLILAGTSVIPALTLCKRRTLNIRHQALLFSLEVLQTSHQFLDSS